MIYEFAYLFGSLVIGLCILGMLMCAGLWILLKAIEGFAKAMDKANEEEMYGKKK